MKTQGIYKFYIKIYLCIDKMTTVTGNIVYPVCVVVRSHAQSLSLTFSYALIIHSSSISHTLVVLL